MQDILNAFEIKRPAILNNLYIQTAISESHGNHNTKICNRYTHKMKINWNPTKADYQVTREENIRERKEKVLQKL